MCAYRSSLLIIFYRRGARFLSQMVSIPHGFFTEWIEVADREQNSEYKRHDQRDYPSDLLRVTALAEMAWIDYLHNLIISSQMGAA
jgi:hypothetical protein